MSGSAQYLADASPTVTPWYVIYFDEQYFDIYGQMLSEDRTTRELDGIEKLLALPPGSRILDLACGHGRHAIPLAQRGYQVTGQDLSEAFLERARAEAQARGVMVRWVHRDMREIRSLTNSMQSSTSSWPSGTSRAIARTRKCCTRCTRRCVRVGTSCWIRCTAMQWSGASSRLT